MNGYVGHRSVYLIMCMGAFLLMLFGMKSIRANEVVSEPVAVSLPQVNFWSDGTDEYYQYDVVVTNQGKTPITEWSAAIDVPSDTTVSQFWNCSCSVEDGVLSLIPADYALVLDAGESSQGIGLIVTTADPEAWSSWSVTYSTGNETGLTVEGEYHVNEGPGAEGEYHANEGPGAEGEYDTNEKYDVVVEHNDDNIESEDSDTMTEDRRADMRVLKAEDNKPVMALHVEGSQLTDENGDAVRLQGISTHGLGVYPEYVSEASFRSLRDDFGANVIRLALYTQLENGYCDGDDARRAAQDDLIDQGVKACTDLGMYVIIDWHILSDGNPLTHADEAEDFFRRMSAEYADLPNVIYEICNEPNGSSWEQEIIPYAERIIPVIRENSPGSLILVGTDTWCQDVDEACADPLAFENIMYCLHFYAGTHREDLRNKLISVLDQGAPVFISECSICDASGNGGVDYNSANAWKELIRERGLSYIEWNLSNKDETSAILKPSCTKLSGWTEEDLSETAVWYRDMMRDLAGIE